MTLSLSIAMILILSSCTGDGLEVSSMVDDVIVPTFQEAQPDLNTWWKPSPGLTWQIQFTGKLNMDLYTDVIDLDMDVDASTVDYYHQRGTKVICYISAGSYEDWRADADQFPDEVLGNDYQGWTGEKWLDIRQVDLLAPIMEARMDICAAKGFDAIEFDNLEIHTNDSGFPITYDDQLMYGMWLAEETHARGMAIGQKNAPDQALQLAGLFDFAIVEDAFYYGWEEEMLPYIKAGKPVFAIEYTDMHGDFDAFCEKSKALGFSTILKKRDLNSWLEICR
jgi:hypothetical protein